MLYLPSQKTQNVKYLRVRRVTVVSSNPTQFVGLRCTLVIDLAQNKDTQQNANCKKQNASFVLQLALVMKKINLKDHLFEEEILNH